MIAGIATKPSTDGATWLVRAGEECMLLPNARGGFPPIDVLPLSRRLKRLSAPPEAVLFDMDGTLASSEGLWTAALEHAAREVYGLAADWPGFDARIDLPHIVGFSTAANMAYLEQRFGNGTAGGEGRKAAARHTLESVLRTWFEAIAAGRVEEVAIEALGDASAHPIAAMPGVALTHAILARALDREELRDVAALLGCNADQSSRIEACSLALSGTALKTAVVTSSSDPETYVVLPALFATLRDEVAAWPVAKATKTRLGDVFGRPERYYDAIVTASRVHEWRLKPYPDLYAIALHELGVSPDRYGRVLGFEDTAAGIYAQRSAGVQLAVAVPFEATQHHDFSAASHVCRDGLWEALHMHGLFFA